MKRTIRQPCPACNRGPRDTALAVTHDERGRVWVCHRCGFSGADNTPTRRPHRPPEKRRAAAMQDWVKRLWNGARPIAPDSAVGRYLAGRRCALDGADLRQIDHHQHGPTGTAWPVMLALITDAKTAAPISLHRTWIAHDGRGKAPVQPARLLAKDHPKAGGVIRLSPDDDVTTGLALAEGIETALTAMADGFRPIWATIDAGNMAAFPLLPGIEALTVFTDNDPAGLGAFDAVARRYHSAGAEVYRVTAPEAGADYNDLARTG